MTTWKIDGSTHGMACKGCADAASAAITLARATGSTGGAHNNNGNHAARVTRKG